MADATTVASPVLAGRTVINPRAVASVALRAAADVPGVVLVPRSRLPGRLAGPARATADLGAASTALMLRLGVSWPRPIEAVVTEVRRHVRTTVAELTGYDVASVDVVVEDLPEVGDLST